MYRAEGQVSSVKGPVTEKEASDGVPTFAPPLAVSRPALIHRVLTNLPKSIDPIRRPLP